MPRVSDLIRAAGWRQGSIARPADTRALLIASVDRVPEPGESIVRLVAVTQDCDLVQEPGIEPFVEFVFCRETEAVEPLYRYGRNPRLLHLQTAGEDGPGPWLHVSIHDRFRVGKETLTGIAVDRDVRLESDDTRLLSRWIAKRYTRPAFPDAFNLRLDGVDGRLERLFKSPEGQVVTGVFLDIADDEFIEGPGGRGQLPTRGSHGSGRAPFGHPAPQIMVSLLNGTHCARRAQGGGDRC